MSKFIYLLAALMAFSAVTVPAAQPIEALLSQLADSDSEIREETLLKLIETGDQRLVRILGDYRLGSLYLWNEQVALGLDLSQNNDLDEFVHMGDLFTREPLKTAAGEPVIVPLEETECIEPSRKERKAALSAIMQLELYAPDTDQRLEAVRKSGLGRNVPGLNEILLKLSENDPKKALVKLNGLAPVVVITLGKNGLIWRNADGAGRMGVFPVDDFRSLDRPDSGDPA